MGKYFGTDGIRGKAFEQLNETLAFSVGQGLSKAFDLDTVVIGYDTRQSSPMLAYMIASGALSQGLNVIFSGVCSTPMLAQYSKDHELIGVMITASHNPYTDNGIKVFNRGYKTTKAEEQLIEEVIDYPIKKIQAFGQFEYVNNFKSSYLKLYKSFNHFQSKLKIVYDSANGGNYQIAKEVFDLFAPNAIQINNEPDGFNINVNCGSTHMNHIQEVVRSKRCDIGFSFDGDGDRLLVCDQERIYDGDEIIYMIARYMRKNGQLKDDHIVLTRMSNPGLLKALRDDDIKYSLTDVGDKYVSEVLHKNDYAIGGESSGHIIINTLLHTGDGLLAAIYLLYVLTLENNNLESAISNYKPYPYRLVNIKDINKEVLNEEETKLFLKNINKKLGEDGLLVVRASGTEPLIRVTVSHENEALVNQTIDQIIEYINKRSE